MIASAPRLHNGLAADEFPAVLQKGEQEDKEAWGARAWTVIALAVADPAGVRFTADGTCAGIVILEPRGRNGFGYDPHMLIPEFGKTMAELELEVKNRISHRGRALAACRRNLEALIRDP
jgi:XTP/dITP diphosphohydrolase